MYGLSEYLEEKKREGTLDGSDIAVLPGIKLLDGLHCVDLVKEEKNRLSETERDRMIYYGKVAENVNQELEAQDLLYEQELYCPVGLVFDVQKLYREQQVETAYPGDKDILGKNVPIEQFELKNGLESITAYIKYFYGSADNYIDEKLARDIVKDELFISRLIAMQEKRDFNKKRLTISLLLKSISIMKEYIVAVILPKGLLQLTPIRDLAREGKIKFIAYRTAPSTAPSEHVGNVSQIYLQIMEEMAYGSGE